MYQIGFAKSEITALEIGAAMQGYGDSHHTQQGVNTPLYARVFYIQDSHQTGFIFACMDLGYITRAIRQAVLDKLAILYPALAPSHIILTCTHTHSGPGGCASEPLYNFVTPNFRPQTVAKIVAGIVDAIIAAIDNTKPSTLTFSKQTIAHHIPVAWNRALRAYNFNPDVIQRSIDQCHLALDRDMTLLTVKQHNGNIGLMTWFGVHATAISQKLHLLDADNKGYAATFTETQLGQNSVAVFAQATAGDVSPHYHGKGQLLERAKTVGNAKREYAYAQRNGQLQSEHALAMLANVNLGLGVQISGAIDSEIITVDFSNIHVDPRFANGRTDAFTSEPCHGVAFVQGTPVDGAGISKPLANILTKVAKRVKVNRLKKLKYMPAHTADYYKKLYAAQGVKNIVIEAGTTQHRFLGQTIGSALIPSFLDPILKTAKQWATQGVLDGQSLVPTILPLQLSIIGNIAIVACPGEFTTQAGQRLVETIRPILAKKQVESIIFSSYCNEYMGYVTTFEEYQAQCYEGGHTVYGQWTLGAFQTVFSQFAQEMLKPKTHRQFSFHIQI